MKVEDLKMYPRTALMSAVDALQRDREAYTKTADELRSEGKADEAKCWGAQAEMSALAAHQIACLAATVKNQDTWSFLMKTLGGMPPCETVGELKATN